MTHPEYTQAVQAGLHFANLVSPNGKVQAAFAAIVKDCEAENRHDYVIRALVGHIYDGLAYGNWPGLTENEKFKLGKTS